MRFLFALLLFTAWPWQHVESGVAIIPVNGYTVAGFKKHFKEIPKCTLKAPHQSAAVVRSVSREWIEIGGWRHDSVSWTCK